MIINFIRTIRYRSPRSLVCTFIRKPGQKASIIQCRFLRMAFDPKRLSAALKSVDIVYSLYPYACTDSSLVFPKGAVLLVVERADDGWCRGYNAGVQGWFPASYVQNVQMDYILKVKIAGGMLFLHHFARIFVIMPRRASPANLYYLSGSSQALITVTIIVKQSQVFVIFCSPIHVLPPVATCNCIPSFFRNPLIQMLSVPFCAQQHGLFTLLTITKYILLTIAPKVIITQILTMTHE